MDAAIITTYRCNAKCKMCNTWKNPSRPSEENTLDIFEKLPEGIGRCNITGGEPMIRTDIRDIVDLLMKKASRVEISTNGYFSERILKLAKQYPGLTIRISVEGLPATNDRIRGIKNGFDKALRTLMNLKEMGLKDIGIATVIQDDNAEDIPKLFELANGLDLEFAQAVAHNSFYFHKFDNEIRDTALVSKQIKALITKFFDTWQPKLWFRGYINKGLLAHLCGEPRLFPCTAGTDIFFLDPYGEIYPCNVMKESMGNLRFESFENIWNGQRAEEIRKKVAQCSENCWMTGTAVPAMKRNILSCSSWVLKNKVRRMLNKEIILE